MDNATLVTVISLAFTDVVSGALLFTPNVVRYDVMSGMVYKE